MKMALALKHDRFLKGNVIQNDKAFLLITDQ